MLIKPLKQQIEHGRSWRIVVVDEELINIVDKDGVWPINFAITNCDSICHCLESFLDVKIRSVVQALTNALCTHLCIDK